MSISDIFFIGVSGILGVGIIIGVGLFIACASALTKMDKEGA